MDLFIFFMPNAGFDRRDLCKKIHVKPWYVSLHNIAIAHNKLFIFSSISMQKYAKTTSASY